MLCLGIETSCDETAVALVDSGRLVAEKLASQEETHALFGGVVPEIASREHLRLLPALYKALAADTGLDPMNLDAVAVSRGPGLLGSLLVGVSFAKGLAMATGARLVGVNHLQAHLAAPALDAAVPYPGVGLVVSGGHTNLYRLRSPWDMELLGRTLDDAAGECLDKAAKAMNLPYPGGRHIDALALASEPDPDMFPRPYLDNDNLDFSFSGLKTAVAVKVAAEGLRAGTMTGPEGLEGQGVDVNAVGRLCASLNLAVVETLAAKAARALARVPGARSLVVSGGVAANSLLRARMASLAADAGVELVMPQPRFCTDNAAMVALLGFDLARAGFFHGLDMDPVPRGRPVPWDYRRDSDHAGTPGGAAEKGGGA